MFARGGSSSARIASISAIENGSITDSHGEAFKFLLHSQRDLMLQPADVVSSERREHVCR
jgi:hypothetical protein